MSADRLARFSQRMAAVTLVLTAAMLLLNAACWFTPRLASVDGGLGLSFALTDRLLKVAPGIAGFPVWQKAGSAVLSSVPLLALAWGLINLRRLFSAYGRGEYFCAAAWRYLGNVGRAVALWVIVDFVCEPLLSVWLTLREPPGQRVMVMSFGSSEILALFLAASVAVIARILQQASALDAEHRLIV